MNTAVEILRRERDAAAEEAKALRVRIKELDAAIALLGQQPSTSKPPVRSEHDLGTLVLEILSGSEGMVAKDIATRLTDGGRKTSDASVSSTLSRLKSDSRVINERGLWFSTTGRKPDQSQSNDDPFDDDDPFGPGDFDDAVIERVGGGGFTDDLDDDIAF